jgi:hypothetical protein
VLCSWDLPKSHLSMIDSTLCGPQQLVTSLFR